MPPLTVVPNFNVLKGDLHSQGSGVEGVVSTFAFQGLPEAFFHGIIITTFNTTHTDLHLSLFQQR